MLYCRPRQGKAPVNVSPPGAQCGRFAGHEAHFARAHLGTTASKRRKATVGRAFGPSTDPLRSPQKSLNASTTPPLPVSWRTADMKKNSLGNGRALGARHGAGAAPAEDHQDRLHQHVQRPGRRDRQRHAQLVRARARSSRPQARRPAGRGHLRGRPDQARGRRAEDPEADRVRQGRFHRRLHLVERAAGLAQAAGRFQDLHDRHQRRRLAARRRAVLALRVLDLVEQRPDAAGDRPLHEPEGRQDRLPDRPELRRRQGHAGRRGARPSRARSSATS